MCRSKIERRKYQSGLYSRQGSRLGPVFGNPYGNFAMQEKGGNRSVPGPDYMVDALTLPKQAPKGSGESLQKCVTCNCPDGTQHIPCWPDLVNR
ncbi:hypothetical protein TNCV_4030191 [Trichonephila clavipes]|nr:hypothetical protein TNCV_4030191 [Trichonephila clavipes]